MAIKRTNRNWRKQVAVSMTIPVEAKVKMATGRIAYNTNSSLLSMTSSTKA